MVGGGVGQFGDLKLGCRILNSRRGIRLPRGLRQRRQLRKVACMGTGPVDAIYSAIEQATGSVAKLLKYQVSAVTSGIDAPTPARL